MLDRLSVFAGGFTLDAAEAVAADDEIDAFDVLDHVGALVDKSLVVADPGNVTYRLLETIRQYAAGRLAESGASRRRAPATPSTTARWRSRSHPSSRGRMTSPPWPASPTTSRTCA